MKAATAGISASDIPAFGKLISKRFTRFRRGEDFGSTFERQSRNIAYTHSCAGGWSTATIEFGEFDDIGRFEMLGEFFDRKQSFSIQEHCRPHWSQAGAVVFITIRTHDSIPREVVIRWEREKQEWLRQRGLLSGPKIEAVVANLPPKVRREFSLQFNRRRQEFLDTCQGECVLRQPALAEIVANSLLHFDGDRYRLGDFVVMPNHVHLLAAFPTEEAMGTQCESWMRYTATRINRALGQQGAFWQEEPFDHLVRSPEQYDYLRQYIADNPTKAKLKVGEYFYWRYVD